jgi:poly(3-hydroxybutyrate) depolymerase
MLHRSRVAPLVALALLVAAVHAGPAMGRVPALDRWWSDAAETALGRAGDRADAWRSILPDVPVAHRPGVTFLLEHMPDADLRALAPELVLENVAYAYAARERAPWGDAIPEDIFLNDVLPYANVNERREPWRADFYRRFMPVVEGCETPAEAAQRLNETIFGELGVRYSTERNKPDQSPSESIEIGMASCTGLSILLSDACRAVGVPARVAGIPSWVNKPGNHTWVEVWDGAWHFTGAAEPDGRGLNHAWFAGDAALARRDDPEHAIYATSFRDTGVSFPLVWAPDVDWISAVNVTDRYAPPDRVAADDTARLMVRVMAIPQGVRLRARVTVFDGDGATILFRGDSHDASFDTNDHLTFEVPRGRAYRVSASLGQRRTTTHVEVGAETPQVDVELQLVPPGHFGSDDERPMWDAMIGWYVADRNRERAIPDLGAWDERLRVDPDGVRDLAWAAYREAPGLHDDTHRDYETHRVRFGEHESPYTVRPVGKRPANGWPLFIAMHGGGGAPQELNDSQWRHMQEYYRDQPDAGGYLYLALRAPNNTWNGFYDDYVYPLVANLIRQFLLFGDVDPDRVFLMGYSHGGYGAFAIGPKTPDRFAAIHSSAAAPTDGESSPRTLRNTVFTFMIGENDEAHGRIDRCRAFDEAVRALRGDRTDVYPVTMTLIENHGHRGLPDRDMIRTMYPAVRNAAPRELSWEMTDGVVRDFFWLSVPEPAKGREVEASCHDNRIELTTNVDRLRLHLDERLVDLDEPLVVQVNGVERTHALAPSVETLCRTIARRGDPRLAATARIEIDMPETPQEQDE